MAQTMTRGQALVAGMVAGASVMLLMMPVYLWFPSALFPRSWQLGSGPPYDIVLLYLIALFAISAFTGAKTGRVMVTAAGLWVGQTAFVLALTFTFTIYLVIYHADSSPQGIIVTLALTLPLVTLFGVAVSLAGARLGRATANSR
jgi:hypothetical protein